ncbi:gas vesicle protein GvpO [Nocardioides sp. NPDC047086]|uniref:gas vesicle protein GvpO n=1 Tax=Nocardioides sp. NPDC047086 TaxID=3154810 RepID=UPI0033F737E9
MGLITQLLTLPIAPVRGVVWVAEQIRDEAESQYFDPAIIQAALEDVDARREAGLLTEEEAADLEALVGCPAEGVTAIRRDDGWVVSADILELERVPETTDVLVSYEVTVDPNGEITGYRRVHRYVRAQVDDR